MKYSIITYSILAFCFAACNGKNDSQSSKEVDTPGSTKFIAQQESTIANNSLEKRNLYEIGEEITNYETNFKNLFNNWTTENITNAGEYELMDFSYIETISDSSIYKKYRNYFSSDEPVSFSNRTTSRGGSDTETITALYIWPGHLSDGYMQSPELSEDFKKQLVQTFRKKIDVDALDLQYYSYSFSESEKTESADPQDPRYSSSSSAKSSKIASVGGLSQDYIDISVKGTKSWEQLDSAEVRLLLLEEIELMKIQSQLAYNQIVDMGDVVYQVRFSHKGELYSQYVILDAETKKVKMDSFFNGIALPPEND